MLPEGWRETQLGDLLSRPPRNGYSPVEADEETGLGVLSLSALTGSGLDLRQTKRAPDTPQVRAALLRKGDLLISRANTPDKVGRAALFNSDREDMSYPDLMMRARVDIDKADNRFVAYLLQSTPVSRRLQARAAGTSSTMVKLTKGAVETLKVGVPNRDLQARIAEILSSWDQAIETVDKLIDNARARKKALMQQLLTGKRRLRGFEGEWEEVRLGQLFSERTERAQGNEPLLSITRARGVIPHAEAGRKDSSNEDKSKYKVLRRGDIGYNTMRMWQGASALSVYDGIVSPAYTIVVPNDRMDAHFAAHLFKLPRMVHDFQRYSQGLTSDQWTLKFPAFSEIKVRVAQIPEQHAIASVLDDADLEIDALVQLGEKLTDEKRALMQQLLTGKRRVKVKEVA